MTDPVCEAYVAAFVRHLGGAVVLIGRDLRPSSPRIAAACARAVAAGGAVAIECGVVPTPALALEALRLRACAVMVSGSHIPFDRNGLKFYRPDGEISKEDEAGIVAALAPPAEIGGATCRRRRRSTTTRSPRATSRAPWTSSAAARSSGQRIGVWQHSAAGRDLLVEALAALGAEVVALGRTDDFVPIDTEAVAPGDAARIRAWVAEHALDALVSTDGDGDRPLIADETGTVLRGDAVGALTARLLGADGVATPLNSSTALERSGWFPRIARTRIGSPFVIAALAALRAEGAHLPVGYEANGGFLTGGTAAADGRVLSPLPTRDALVPIAGLLTRAARSGGLARLVATLPPRATASDRLPDVPEAISIPLLAALAGDADERAALLAGLDEARVTSLDTLDGVRMTLASGDIVHLRRSGNAPELRLYTEAAAPAQALALLATVLDRVRGRLLRG